MARPSLKPNDLDPLDAAATEISPDPVVAPAPRMAARMGRPRVSEQDQLQSMRGEKERRISAYVARGMSPEDAARKVFAEMTTSFPELDAFEESRLTFNDRYDSALAARREAQQAALTRTPTDPLDEPRTVEELRGMGLFGESEPGPSTADGMPVRRPQEFTTEREAQGYTTRTPISRDSTDPATFDFATGRPAAFAPSQRDRDMAARGFEAVYGDDGTVGYSVAAPINEANPVPGAPGRRGQRADLEGPLMRDGKPVLGKDGNPVPMYEAVPVRGPSGTHYVYRPTDELRQKNAALNEEQRIRRQANAAGMSADDIAAMDPAARRRAVSDARDARQRQLVDNVRAVGMLTGGQPSWGRGGTGTTAMQYLQMPQDWRNAVMAQNLAPGLDGTTPLTVEATSNKNAMRLLTADLLREGMQGQGGGDVFRQKNRDAAQAAFDKMYDDAGHGGRTGRAYTPADRNRFVNYLRNQYGLSQPEAEAIADSRGLAAEIVPTPPPPAAGADPSAGTAAAIL
jgi:hypothetical protein